MYDANPFKKNNLKYCRIVFKKIWRKLIMETPSVTMPFEVNQMPRCTVGFNEAELKMDTGEYKNDSLERFLLLNKDTIHPIYYGLIDIKWDVFGTITWQEGLKRQETGESEWLRRNDFRMLIKKTRLKLELRANDIFYYHAMEWGTAKQCHFHFLIKCKNIYKTSPSILADTLRNIWTTEICPDSCIPGMGTAQIEPFDFSRRYACVRYCTKKEYEYRGFDRFERERFDYPSPNLVRMLIKNANPILNPSNN